jgi:hypothetical protein
MVRSFSRRDFVAAGPEHAARVVVVALDPFGDFAEVVLLEFHRVEALVKLQAIRRRSSCRLRRRPPCPLGEGHVRVADDVVAVRLEAEHVVGEGRAQLLAVDAVAPKRMAGCSRRKGRPLAFRRKWASADLKSRKPKRKVVARSPCRRFREAGSSGRGSVIQASRDAASRA